MLWRPSIFFLAILLSVYPWAPTLGADLQECAELFGDLAAHPLSEQDHVLDWLMDYQPETADWMQKHRRLDNLRRARTSDPGTSLATIQRLERFVDDYSHLTPELVLPSQGLHPFSTAGFVQMPGGAVILGSSSGVRRTEAGRYDGPERRANLNPFWISKTQVTQAQWAAVMGKNPAHFKNRSPEVRIGGDAVSLHYPMESISWASTLVFANETSKLGGFKEAYDLSKARFRRIGGNQDLQSYAEIKAAAADGLLEWVGGKITRKKNNGYRLPTEAEWEYAVRGRVDSRDAYSFGDDVGVADADLRRLIGEHAWWHPNSNGSTQRVRTKKPNSVGLFDGHGNVWEWVEDRHEDSLPGTGLTARVFPPKDPTFLGDRDNESGSYRVLRGGSWSFDAPQYLRSAPRNWFDPRSRGRGLGFRLVRTP